MNGVRHDEFARSHNTLKLAEIAIATVHVSAICGLKLIKTGREAPPF